MLNEIKCDFEENICFFYIEDETIETDVDVFLDMLREALADTPTKGFILSFQNVSYLSSTTIGFLFVLLKEFQKPTVPFVLCHVNQHLMTTINLVGMTKLCRVKDTVEEAVAFVKQLDSTEKAS